MLYEFWIIWITNFSFSLLSEVCDDGLLIVSRFELSYVNFQLPNCPGSTKVNELRRHLFGCQQHRNTAASRQKTILIVFLRFFLELLEVCKGSELRLGKGSKYKTPDYSGYHSYFSLHLTSPLCCVGRPTAAWPPTRDSPKRAQIGDEFIKSAFNIMLCKAVFVHCLC